MKVKKISAVIFLLISLNSFSFANNAGQIAFSSSAFDNQNVTLFSSKPKPPKPDKDHSDKKQPPKKHDGKDKPKPPKKDKDKEPPPPKKHHHHRHEPEYTFADFIAELFVDVISIIWGYNNLYVSYEEYPYQYDNHYICHPDTNSLDEYELKGDPDGTRPYRFSASTEVFCDNNLGFGNTTAFEGIFYRFFGPVVENTLFYDKNFKNFNGNLRVGGKFGIIQNDYFNLFNTFMWDYRYGYNISYPLSNFFFACDVSSYPLEPIVLNYRFSLTDGQRLDITEHSVSLGFMHKREELYLKYIYRKTRLRGNKSETHSGAVGTRIYF